MSIGSDRQTLTRAIGEIKDFKKLKVIEVLLTRLFEI